MRENYLDGLRGWAALVVVIGHTVLGVLLPKWEPRYHLLFIDGTFSVFVFFVLSGYVLSVGFYRSGRRRDVVDMALRRYPRLTIPILVVCAIAFLMMMTGWMRNIPAGMASGSEHWLATFYGFAPRVGDLLQFSFWRVYVDPSALTSYNSSLWTMPVEMQGSIIVFAVLLAVGRGRVSRLIGHALFLAVTCWLASPFFAMAAGMAIADFAQIDAHRRLKAWRFAPALSWLLLLGAVVLAAVRRQSMAPVLLTVCSAAVLYAVLLSALFRRALSGPISNWLGRISFSLYLVHILVICSLTSWAYLAIGHGRVVTGIPAVGLGLLTVGASLLTAAAFYPLERFGISAGRRFSAAILNRRV